MPETDQALRIWLDDIRPCPRDFDLRCTTAAELIAVLERGCSREIRVAYVSLDHHLGSGGTGMQVAQWIANEANRRRLPKFGWEVHTDNAVMKAAMEFVLFGADRAWLHGEPLDRAGK